MVKKIFLFLLFFFFASAGNTHAFKPETFVTFANPVRGSENWQIPNQHPLDLPLFQYTESTHSAFPVTWLLRYDAVVDATMSAFFNDLIETDKNQSLGAFLEITPQMATAADVLHNPGISPFDANRIFLSGYTIYQREALIDAYMSAFFSRFGFYPKSVSAWHLDSYSLQYLQSKYSVVAAMNCDEQYSTDHYRLWGGYLGSPYFPDKNNSLIPAKSYGERVNLAMVRWAQRDPANFYGGSSESSYSLQVNDYLGMKQDLTYFEKLLNIYGQKSFNEFTQINIGLENDYSLKLYGGEIKKQFALLKKNKEKFNLHPISLSDFGEWFKARYPESSPAYFYTANKSYWYQSPFYRLGIRSYGGRTELIDFRVYNRNIFEDYYATRNESFSLYHEIPAVIDTVKYPGTEAVIFEAIDSWEVVHSKQWDNWQVAFKKDNKSLILEPDRIVFSNITAPEVTSKDIKVTKKGSETVWELTPYTPFKKSSNPSALFILAGMILVIYLIKKSKKTPDGPGKRNIIIGVLISLIAGLTVFRSGILYPFGMGFWGPNGHDAIFHLSIIENFAKNPFSFLHPQIAGEKIANYHFLFDYLSGLVIKLTGISSLDFYFRIFPVLAGISIVYLLDKLLQKWNYSRQERLLSILLAFLAGSLGFIPKLLTGQDVFAGESAFWANQSVSIFLNPPFALSIIVLLLFLNFQDKKNILFLSILGGLLAQTKVYAFILLLGSLLLAKKYKLFLGVLIIGILISLPFTILGGQSPFIFSPLWFTRSLFASYDRFYWLQLVTAWQAYEASGSFIKLLSVNLFALVVFVVGNLGVRIFGFYELLKSKVGGGSENIVRWLVVFGILIPLLFVQNINPWNTIQFMYYSLFFLSVYTARFLSRMSAPIFILLLFVSVLTSIGTLRDYIGFFSSSRVGYTELLALDKLRDQPKGIVLSPLFSEAISRTVVAPKPLYSYVSTSYISALSGQPEFLSDTINLDITGYDYKDKARDVQRFYNTEDESWANEFLLKNNITYVYETPLKKIKVNPSNLALKKIFDSGEITVYKHVIPD